MREWLIENRMNRSLTQLAVSEMAGISRAYYAQLESGMRNPSIKVAIRLAKLLEFEWTNFYKSKMHEYEVKGTVVQLDDPAEW